MAITTTKGQIQHVQRLITHAYWTAQNKATREVLLLALRELLPIASENIPKGGSRIVWLIAAHGGEDHLADALRVGVNVVKGWKAGKAPSGAVANRVEALSVVYALPKDTLGLEPDKQRPGRPFGTQEENDSVSRLAKEMGGWASLAAAIGGLHQDTPRSWVSKNKVPQVAVQNLVEALCLVNGIPKPAWGKLKPDNHS
jgi:hypothetical protein